MRKTPAEIENERKLKFEEASESRRQSEIRLFDEPLYRRSKTALSVFAVLIIIYGFGGGQFGSAGKAVISVFNLSLILDRAFIIPTLLFLGFFISFYRFYMESKKVRTVLFEGVYANWFRDERLKKLMESVHKNQYGQVNELHIDSVKKYKLGYKAAYTYIDDEGKAALGEFYSADIKIHWLLLKRYFSKCLRDSRYVDYGLPYLISFLALIALLVSFLEWFLGLAL